MYYDSVLDIIGNTPLVKINALNPNKKVTLLAKLEYLNPGGSVKDRIGIEMLNEAERKGKLKRRGTIIEPTSGNTGTGLAMVAALRGYKTIFVMPDKMSDEKRNLLRAYGAKVVITPTSVEPEDERSYYKVSDRLVKEIPNSYKPDQYHNKANPKAHYKTTGPEIWEQTAGKITHFVCGMGTGGTISGIGKYLKEKNPKIKVIGVDPVGSVFFEYFKTGKYTSTKPYKTEGVGEDFIPITIDFSVIDKVIQITDEEALTTPRALAQNEGMLVGGSSGMAFVAAQNVVSKLKKGLVVVLFPDSGKSYLSKIFNDDWMRDNSFLNTGKMGVTVGAVLKNKQTPKLVSVSPKQTVKRAIDVMTKHDFSQLLVVDGNKLLGKVTERHLLSGLYQKSIGPTNKVSVVTNPEVITVPTDETTDRVSELLSKDNLVVVVKKGKPIGVVTRIDLIEYYS